MVLNDTVYADGGIYFLEIKTERPFILRDLKS